MNGEQLGRLNHRAFVDWITERRTNKDWADWIWKGDLNKSAIAQELRFERKAFYTNKDIEAGLRALEQELREAEILPKLAVNTRKPDPELAGPAVGEKLAINDSKKQTKDAQRIRSLEHDNAALREQVKVLRDALGKYEMLQDALERTGRVPR
jgi:hypothetical protein